MNRLTVYVGVGIIIFLAYLAYCIGGLVDVQTANIIAFVAIVLPVAMLTGAMIALIAKRDRRPATSWTRQVNPVEDWNEISPPAPAFQLPPPQRVINVPVIYQANKPMTLTMLSTSVDAGEGKREELKCSTSTLKKAINLVETGQQPTRSSFNSVGVMANAEISAAVSFLAAHGFIMKAGKGSPARWADGLTGDALAQWLRQWE